MDVGICLAVIFTQFSGGIASLKSILFDKLRTSFLSHLKATGGPIEGVEVWNSFLFKITPGHPSGMNFCLSKVEFSFNARNGAILAGPAPRLDRETKQHEVRRSPIKLRHAAFVYVAKMHRRNSGFRERENDTKKKSVWGGAIRPCKRRIASRPSRIVSFLRVNKLSQVPIPPYG